MISEIRSEAQLKNRIDEMKANEIYEEQNKKIIIIHFEQSNTNKIQFISDYIINYYKNDEYNYIFLVHIKRFFSENQDTKERIYSIPNINNDINHLFIDNLNGPSGLTLKNIITKEIKNIMIESGSSMDEETEFKKSLLNFVYTGIDEKNKSRFLDSLNEDEYSNKLLNYMENNKDFKRKIIKKAKDLIDEDKNAKGDCGSLIDKMLKDNYINKNSIDLISCIMDYIKDNIFNKNLEKIFTFLEDNNFLTTLLEIDFDPNDKNKLGKDIILELTDEIFSKIKVDEEKLEPKFLFGYKIPGFYNFYKNLSETLNKNITAKFLSNEKNLREYLGSKPDRMKNDFHEKEESLLNEVLEEIKKIKLKKDKIKKEPLVIDYKTIAIHIDLMESKEISVINEFLFSFLITKFYTYNEDIIYIPNNLNIYIEIPNCFQNYLAKISILKVFNIENIVLGEVKQSEKKKYN